MLSRVPARCVIDQTMEVDQVDRGVRSGAQCWLRVVVEMFAKMLVNDGRIRRYI